MTTVHTLASGSSGNALVLSWEGGHILVDAGISCRRVRQGLQALGLDLGDLDGIFITHTHSDHISGLQTLLKRTDCPVCASVQAGRDLLRRMVLLEDRLRETEGRFFVKDCAVTAFPTSHDAPGSRGYRFDTPDGGFGLLTDSGVVTPEAAAVLPGVALAVLEANHDVETLRSGPYPYFLKKRILGPEGHLPNEDAAAFAVTLARAGAREIVLAHLSRENNTPAMALRTVETALNAAGLRPRLSAAPRDGIGGAYVLEGGAVCGG
ncbi:MBL fold metallo-hydrolase [uncultured Oscillibacter sp.]|uniref:MBL fold metallo-hydrolase n=1 Tax=uncultured Oscillibacter sp. TaxID=876091 RepID=UPI00262D22DC|nr:MBL fold metallo-hydrolase [uncultured Oscillibacter sp.]